MAIECPKCKTSNPADSKFCKECATPLPSSGDLSFTRTLETPAKQLVRGSLFAGRYEIIEELGAGGMGLVYRAYDKKMEEEVAIKLIRPGISAAKQTVERFRNEIKTARKIRHAHVCGMFDLHEENKTLFITMEYVRGEDLKSVIKRMRILAPGTAVSIAGQVAQGLGEAHRLGVVHRDLKPSNVMIDKDGNAKIMDFGIARSLASGGITAEGAIIGTPEYMSPEQVEGTPADQRADLYALGIILFEMVTGHTPFQGETPLAIAHKHKYEPPPDPQTLNPQVPKDLSTFILRCMEKSPEKRYQTAEEFLTGLEGVAMSLPAAERVPAIRPSGKRKTAVSKTFTVKITPRKFIIPALTLLILLVGALVIGKLFPKEPVLPYHTDKPSLAVLHFMNNTGDTNLDNWSTGLSYKFITRLQQSQYLNILPFDRLLSVLDLLGLQDAQSYSSDDLERLASRKIGKYLMDGAYFQSGENFEVILKIHDSQSDKPVRTLRDVCQGTQGLSDLVDRLSLEIKKSLDLSEAQIAADIDRALGDIDSDSLEAAKLFCDGMALYIRGNQGAAIEPLKQAVALDQNLVMAYRMLHAVLMNTGRGQEAEAYWKKAMALKDEAPERQRLLLEAEDYYWKKRQPEEALIPVTKLLERWPEDLLANRLVYLIYANFGLGDIDKAIEYARRVIRLYPESALDWGNLADLYWYRSEYKKAERVLSVYAEDFPDSRMIHIYLSWHFCLTNDFDRALGELEIVERLRLSSSRNNWFWLNLYFAKGDLDILSRKAEELLESDQGTDQARGRYIIFNLHRIRGRLEEAKRISRENVDKAMAIEMRRNFPKYNVDLAVLELESGNNQAALEESREALRTAEENKNSFIQKWALVLKGQALLALNSINEAQKTADELVSMLQEENDEYDKKMLYRLEGLVELKAGHHKKAVELLEKAESLLRGNYGDAGNIKIIYNVFYYDALAQAYFSSGKWGSAKARYEKISSTGLFRHVPEIWVKSHYWLGRIAEERGKKAEAGKRYQEFLELWKDADPGLTEVEDAKRRLASIRNQ